MPENEAYDNLPKRARMLRRIVGGVFIRHDGRQRRCFCEECLNTRSNRASEKARLRDAR